MVSIAEDVKTKRMYTACIAEAMGTMLLVLVACGAAQSASGSSAVAHISLAFGFSVGTIVWMIGHISGGHINPAVTIGLVAARRITIIRGLLYIGSQIGGAVAGAYLLRALSFENASLGHCSIAMIGSGAWLVAGAIECLEAFILVFTVFSSVDSNRSGLSGSIPLTVGVCIAMCHFWAIRWTGSAMNPARALGPAIARNQLSEQWVYWLGPLAGGVGAGLMYDFFFAVNATPKKLSGCCRIDYDDADYDSEGRRLEAD